MPCCAAGWDGCCPWMSFVLPSRIQLQAWSRRREALTPQDVGVQTPPYPDIKQACLQARHMPGPDDDGNGWQCRFCDRILSSREARNTHEARAHQSQATQAKAKAAPFLLSRDAVPGSWSCAHCGMHFQRCLSLSRRISQGSCRQFDPNREPSSQPCVARPQVQQVMLEQGIDTMCATKILCQELATSCALCGRRMDHA